jgi:hypothetical protein
MTAARFLAAVLCAAILAVPLLVRGESRCGTGGDRIVALSRDRYAVRSEPSAADQGRARFVIRRLGSDEPLDQIECAASGPCELTTVLGMRGCSYAAVSAGRSFRGLSLDAPNGGESPLWKLSINGSHGRVGLLSLSGTGPLSLRAAVPTRHGVVVIVTETEESGGAACPQTTDYAVMLDERDIRDASDGIATGRVPQKIDLHRQGGDPMPPLRTATAYRAMPVHTVIRAARTAAAVGMDRLAACWIAQNASVMPPRDLPDLAQALFEDPILSRLVPQAQPGRRVSHLADAGPRITVTGVTVTRSSAR